MKTFAFFHCLYVCTFAFAYPHVEQDTVSRRDLSSVRWSGAIVTAPEGASFNGVTSTIKVPSVTGPIDAAYSAYAWIGIDGWGGLNNLFQAGLDVRGIEAADGTYEPQFRGYFEWYPEEANFFTIDELPLSSGDTLLVRIVASSSTKGTVYLENERTGESKEYNFDEPSYALTGTYAEWIVEEFSNNTVPSNCIFEFQSAEAQMQNGQTLDASSGSLVQVEDGRLVASFENPGVKVVS
ncbi:hypothetical protein N7504_007012 [Penicillium tannophilum]|nr:hypothetical protein N7504_007012 [Penicillium tannophilum]